MWGQRVLIFLLFAPWGDGERQRLDNGGRVHKSGIKRGVEKRALKRLCHVAGLVASERSLDANANGGGVEREIK